MDTTTCYHCGDPIAVSSLVYDLKPFCCHGCQTVYQIFSENDLSYYYELQAAAGTSPIDTAGKFNYLDTPSIAENLLEFNDGEYQIINLYIPNIHCSSCIWILENLGKLDGNIINSQVDFPQKTVRISFRAKNYSLKELVTLLARIGYDPNISLEHFKKEKKRVDRSLIYKLGVAGFAFGNVMFLSFPEYFDVPQMVSGVSEYWLEAYRPLFRWLIFAFSVPVLLYSAQDYLISAFKGLKNKYLNIDVPIALGIIVLFGRSFLEILYDWGPGYFDSLTGLVFFLLVGKYFQQKTYAFLSFERDYKSYFPIAVTRLTEDRSEEHVQVYDIEKGDRLLIHNLEIIPVDGILKSAETHIDYSFVTGEAQAVLKRKGDTVYAGGKQLSGAMEMEVLKKVSQSYLTQLWAKDVFQKDSVSSFQTLTDSIGKRFTISVLFIAFSAMGFWFYYDPGKAIHVFTAVLIIACPCAIALAAPFTLGNLLRIFGRRKFYLKNTRTIEQMAGIDTVIFDKTGTLTSTTLGTVSYEGTSLSEMEAFLLKNTLRASSHPLSRRLYSILAEYDIAPLDDFREQPGGGLVGRRDNCEIKIGSQSFIGNASEEDHSTSVNISTNSNYKGRYVFQSDYREGISALFKALADRVDLAILSGDNDGEKQVLEKLLKDGTPLHFNQKPEDKLNFIKQLQEDHKQVMMVGDGLNDAGALAQSDVGLAISENINVFSPACDGILDAAKIGHLPAYLLASRRAMKIIKMGFVFSLFYNVIGLYFAVTGQLQPVIAAILMPLSSISIVAFTTLATNLLGRNLE